MSYLSHYKKRVSISGTNVKSARMKESRDETERNFEQMVGHVEARRNVGEPIDLVVESTANYLVCKGMLRYDAVIHSGDYLTFNDQTWIVRGINRNLMNPQVELYFCNQKLNFPAYDEGVPCYVNNTTYGSKGTILAGDKFLELDAKTKIFIQRNVATETLYLGKRIMLGHRYVYRITEMDDTVYPGMFVITCQLDEKNIMDDFEHNLAYNEKDLPLVSPSTPSNELGEILGEGQLKRKTTQTYTLSNPLTGEWFVDGSDFVAVEATTPTSITLKGIKNGWVTLSFQTTEGKTLSFEILVC